MGYLSIVPRLQVAQPGLQSPQGQCMDLFLLYRVKSSSRTHPASYPLGVGDSYPR